MNYDSFLGEKRWEILKRISEAPASPLEISSAIGTSVSYVSQQLKLLEAAGFVKKKRTGSVDKGSPRSIYYIEREVASYSVVQRGSSIKSFVGLDFFSKVALNTLNFRVENKKFIFSLILKVDSYIQDIECMFFNEKKNLLFITLKKSSARNLIEGVAKLFGVKILFEGDVTSVMKDGAYSQVYLSSDFELNGGESNEVD